jgi:hypothetical protein
VSQRWLLLVLGALAGCLAAMGLFLLGRSAAPEPEPTPVRTAVATQSRTTDPGVGDAGVGAPVVVANPKVGAVEFTWSYSGPKSTDSYNVHIGSTPEDAQIADPVALTKATYSVKTASGSPMCLIATVVRGDQISPASPAVCASAR